MAKSKNDLIYDIQNELVDPTTNKITGERVKARLLDMVETMAESAGSGGGGAMEYWGVPADYEADAMGELCGLCVLGKFINGGVNIIASAGLGTVMADNMIAVAFDPNIKMVYPGVGIAPAKDILTLMGVTDLSEVGLVPMTEDAFYTF